MFIIFAVVIVMTVYCFNQLDAWNLNHTSLFQFNFKGRTLAIITWIDNNTWSLNFKWHDLYTIKCQLSRKRWSHNFYSGFRTIIVLFPMRQNSAVFYITNSHLSSYFFFINTVLVLKK